LRVDMKEENVQVRQRRGNPAHLKRRCTTGPGIGGLSVGNVYPRIPEAWRSQIGWTKVTQKGRGRLKRRFGRLGWKGGRCLKVTNKWGRFEIAFRGNFKKERKRLRREEDGRALAPEGERGNIIRRSHSVQTRGLKTKR